jgi:hypothetical protein
MVSSIVAATGVLATALAFAASQPAAARPACAKPGSSSSCIRGNDLKPRLNLGGDGKDARLRLRDADGANGVELNAGSGNVTNLFSNEEDESNGLVKAWAQIFSDGTVIACWRCNKDPNGTRRLVTGPYEVDFTPLATDITGRPRSGTIDTHTESQLNGGVISILSDRSGDPSSVLVVSRDAGGSASDLPFVLIIH